MKPDENPLVPIVSCALTALLFVLGFTVLAVRLRSEQLEQTADRNFEMMNQSVRRVQTGGIRGRILARNGEELAVNVQTSSIVLNLAAFQRRTWKQTAAEIRTAIDAATQTVGRASALTDRDIERHINQKLARPLVVWNNVSEDELSRFAEHESELPGFSHVDALERRYPQGRLASQLLGYVGRERAESEAGDKKFNYYDFEMRGRAGIEFYYDSFLRGVPGERNVRVDARGFPCAEWEVVSPRPGPDLQLTIDVPIQREAERQLAGLCGACVVLDPRDGAVLALASAPGYDPNAFVPVLRRELYDAYAADPRKPLLNRACGEGYAPGSTFKPITALAGLGTGMNPDAEYECIGAFSLGEFRIRCARTWGHGELDLRHALKESCNSYFCRMGYEAGTNAVITAAQAFGLGAKTGIDFGTDFAGVVPDDAWKRRYYEERWYPGDVAQMSIGQGMLLVTPLQMARVIGAIGTGRLVTPHLKAGMATDSVSLPYPSRHLEVVREGLHMVVEKTGTGHRGAEGVEADVMGKTGTAEVGRGATRRKNTWFVAHAKGTDASRPDARAREVAVAMVVERGESGGGTTAPKVREILKTVFNNPESAQGGAE